MQEHKTLSTPTSSTEPRGSKEFNVMTAPEIPVILTNESTRLEYLIKHFWDHSSIGDTLFLHHREETEQAWANYIGGLSRLPKDIAINSIKELFSRPDWHEKVYQLFTDLAEKYFYNPNSPYRNEELYIPVLESMISSLSDESLKSTPQYRLQMVLRNRIGNKAIDFKYTLLSGKEKTLYSLQAEYTLLFINNPGCDACSNSIRFINNSEPIQRFLKSNRITILSFYPDEDQELWRRHYSEYPKNWTVGYDKDLIVLRNNLYDLKAIPSFYLLDKGKTVLLKDATLQEIERYLNTLL